MLNLNTFKKWRLCALASISGSILFLTCCASTKIKHLDAAQFVERAEGIEQMNSAMWTRYVGTTQGRVYLEHQDMLTVSGGPQTTVYWTELDSLPKEIGEKLKNGIDVWTPPARKVEPIPFLDTE